MRTDYYRLKPEANDRLNAQVEEYRAKHGGRLARNVTEWSCAAPTAASLRPHPKQVEQELIDPIPPFDPSVVNAIYKKFGEFATRGTTRSSQFVFAIAKAVVGRH